MNWLYLVGIIFFSMCVGAAIGICIGYFAPTRDERMGKRCKCGDPQCFGYDDAP